MRRARASASAETVFEGLRSLHAIAECAQTHDICLVASFDCRS
jgi:hypothetical protein